MSNNEWATPDDLFQVLDKGGVWQGIEFEGYHFGIDLAANFDSHKCDVFFLDYLKNDFYIWGASNECYPSGYKDLIKDTTCFCNPPYSRDLIGPMMAKAWEDSKHCKIVCLVKVDPSTKWWATFWAYGVPLYHYCAGTEYYTSFTKLLDDKKWFTKETVYNGPKPGCEVIFFPRRIKFDAPIGWKAERVTQCGNKITKEPIKLNGPSFASCLVIMDRRGL